MVEEQHILAGAKWLKPEEEVDSNKWSRNPNDYSITNKFRRRYSELSSVMSGEIIEDAIKYGDMIQASQGHIAFVNDLGGVTISIIVNKHRGYDAVSIWPYVYDRDEALDTGRWSTKQLFRMEEYVEEHKNDKLNWQDY